MRFYSVLMSNYLYHEKRQHILVSFSSYLINMVVQLRWKNLVPEISSTGYK